MDDVVCRMWLACSHAVTFGIASINGARSYHVGAAGSPWNIPEVHTPRIKHEISCVCESAISEQQTFQTVT